MNNKMLMAMMANRRQGQKGRRVGVEYEDWGPRDSMGYDRSDGYSGAGDVNSRFRDGRGREHYDNGRFAPQSNMDVDARRYNRRRDERFQPRNEEFDQPYMGYRGTPYYNSGPDSWYDQQIHGGDQNMRMIGFSANGAFRGDSGMDASYPRRNEMEYRRGQAAAGYSRSTGVMPLDRQSAEEWVSGMRNIDGSTGAHWTREMTDEIRAKHGITCDPLQFWVAMNMMYSDYFKVAEKLGVNTVEFYVCMAKAFLEDKDAQPDKLARYREYVAGG